MLADLTPASSPNQVGHLYWFYPEVSVEEIARAVSGPFYTKGKSETAVRKMAPALISTRCPRCNAKVPVSSRSALPTRKSHRPWCDQCYAAIQKTREDNGVYATEQRTQRIEYLKSMPYAEYLQTPEWDRVRKEHLRASGYRCQLCNAGGVTLNVHHRTYERRGNESQGDLITLCQTCHKKHHGIDSESEEDTVDATDGDTLPFSGVPGDEKLAAGDSLCDFKDAWDRWHIGDDSEALVPLEDTWSVSVEEWMKRGTSLSLLIDLIPIAMGKAEVPPDRKWAYYTGVVRNTIDGTWG